MISDHIAREGGVRGWIWKGPQAPDSFTIEAHIGYPSGVIRHAMTLADRNGRPELTDEQIEFCGTHADTSAARAYYRPHRGKEILRAAGGVEERERPLQARRHLGEDVAQRVPRAPGAGRRGGGGHGVHRRTARAEVVHLARAAKHLPEAAGGMARRAPRRSRGHSWQPAAVYSRGVVSRASSGSRPVPRPSVEVLLVWVTRQVGAPLAPAFLRHA